MSGATVPIVHDGEPTYGVKLLVGESAATRGLKLTSASFRPQEYLIRFLPTALGLMGQRPGRAWRRGRRGASVEGMMDAGVSYKTL